MVQDLTVSKVLICKPSPVLYITDLPELITHKGIPYLFADDKRYTIA